MDQETREAIRKWIDELTQEDIEVMGDSLELQEMVRKIDASDGSPPRYVSGCGPRSF